MSQALDELNDEHNQQMDSVVSQFSRDLQRSVDLAIARTTSELFRSFVVEEGVILRTPGNMRVIRSIERVLLRELKAAGYESTIDHFVNTFTVEIPWFQRVLHVLSADIGEEFTLKLNKLDFAVLSAQQALTVDQLQSVIDAGAASAKQQALFAVAGLKVSELTAIIASRLDTTVSNADAIADTALPGFYRTIADRAYQTIETDLRPGFEARYKYYGPLDKLNRIFCARMMRLAKQRVTYNRTELTKLDAGKGQPAPVAIFCGGYRCRHSWVITGISRIE